MKLNGVTCFLVGLGTGAVIMLLLAPKSGKDTRRYIGRRFDHGKEYVERGAAKVHEMSEEILDKTKEAAKRTNKALSSAVGAGKSMVSAII
jgi:gas vesicle protein